MAENSSFDVVIRPKSRAWKIDFVELYRYRSLLFMFVKRNFATIYKQTILGPLWVFLNPLLTSVVSTVVFGNLAGLSTDGLPKYLFYLAGNSLWVLLSSCVTQMSYIFGANVSLFSKVYFPRLISPLSQVITDILKFFIQFLLFIGVFLVYLFTTNDLSPNAYMLLFPILVLQIALLAMGTGCIISSVTVKYRDLTILVNFGITAWMYLSPVVYPMSSIGGLMYTIMWFNPMTPIIEIFRYGFLGTGEMHFGYWGLSCIVTLAVAAIGVLMYNKTEKSFLDMV